MIDCYGNELDDRLFNQLILAHPRNKSMNPCNECSRGKEGDQESQGIQGILLQCTIQDLIGTGNGKGDEDGDEDVL